MWFTRRIKTSRFCIFAKIYAFLGKTAVNKVIYICDKHLNSFEESNISKISLFHTTLLHILCRDCYPQTKHCALQMPQGCILISDGIVIKIWHYRVQTGVLVLVLVLVSVPVSVLVLVGIEKVTGFIIFFFIFFFTGIIMSNWTQLNWVLVQFGQ